MDAKSHAWGEGFANEQFRYEFENLELISNDVTSFMKQQWPHEYGLLEDFKTLVHEQANEIKNNLINSSFAFSNERFIERYIQYHQRALIRLAGGLLNVVQPEILYGPVNGRALLIQYVYQSIQELLNFIQKHFTKYFDENAWIPPNYGQILVSEVEGDLETIQKGLLRCGITESLVAAVTKPLVDFVEDKDSDGITYRRVLYIKELKRELGKVSRKKQESLPVNEYLCERMVCINLNSYSLYSYYTQSIIVQLEACNTADERAHVLEHAGKTLNQTVVKDGFAYHAHVRSLKDAVNEWITQESNYLKNRHAQPAPAPDEGERSFKLKLSLSVSQLVYLLRVFIETNVIQNQNIALLIRLATRIAQTKRTTNPSADSARDKYYKVESSTRLAVKNILQKMIDYITAEEKK